MDFARNVRQPLQGSAYTLESLSGFALMRGDGARPARRGNGVALQFSKPLTEPDEALAFRLQVARELHDQVASPLVTLIIELHELRAETGQDADTSQRLATMEETARQALRQTREMVVDMRGQDVLRLGFAAVLREEVLGRFGTKASVSLHVSADWPDRLR